MAGPRQVKEAFEEGKQSELNNLVPEIKTECPNRYDNKPELRKAWFDGYYQSYLIRRHKTTFEKYGIKFP